MKHKMSIVKHDDSKRLGDITFSTLMLTPMCVLGWSRYHKSFALIVAALVVRASCLLQTAPGPVTMAAGTILMGAMGAVLQANGCDYGE